ncbi:hypothetical protein [Lysobacter enzymogenes]|uniref:hypothetical protein n=1 Tax=Lysobacter enzymogenes TaxID=69 RepID=UPI0019CF4C6D|nr:hypothetical protein [Lysobacter enzymogenes]
MSKTAEEQATEIVVALLSTEKGLNYLGDSDPKKIGKSLATVWTEVHAGIIEQRRTPRTP